ncbi:MarR family winged helix-turn-helix transcriptional regulator [Jidongwangia harbinensis]|uniref:MarR family winged helix-turn-helix transcriptional regulator n=1 Tax=Jidongwangia harbinensis TaxID=2878561 RepID=UPI001CD96522|nr:MarR family transcriptional regulator [Jidongwangia harbinensis]MCA2212006.1 MarR family transcriptional regulator [Jidongwangia harbinensis]
MTRVTTLPSWLLSQTAAAAYRLVSEGLAEVGARGYHYRLLAELMESGPASQAELGRRTGIHLSDMVAALNELTDGGYVRRSPDPADRRRNVVTITPAGRRRAGDLAHRVGEIQDELLAPLNAKERAELVRLLGALLDHHRPAVDQPGLR